MNITLQQWLSRQPYTQTTDSDRYYTQLANRVYDLVKISPLKERLTEEATKSLCCDVVGYFADILSGTGLWAPFALRSYPAIFSRRELLRRGSKSGRPASTTLVSALYARLLARGSFPARQSSHHNGR